MIALAFAAGLALGLWLGLNVAENLVNAMSRTIGQGQHQAAELGAVDPLAGMEEAQP